MLQCSYYYKLLLVITFAEVVAKDHAMHLIKWGGLFDEYFKIVNIASLKIHHTHF